MKSQRLSSQKASTSNQVSELRGPKGELKADTRTGEEHVAPTGFDRRPPRTGRKDEQVTHHVGGDLYGASVQKLKTSPEKAGELGAAIEKNDLAAVKRFIAEGYDVNQADADGGHAIATAAYFGKSEILDVLIAARADFSVLDPEYQATALHGAAYGGQLEAVKKLLDAGHPIDAQALRNGFTPLHDAAWQGHLKVAELLLERGASALLQGHEDGKTGITAAATARANGHPRIAALIERAMEQQRAATE